MIAIVVAAIASDYRAWAEMKRIDSIVQLSLQDLDVSAAERFGFNHGRSGPLSSYSFAGNSHGQARGGFFQGPRNINLHIVIGDDVLLDVQIDSAWYFFAGKPTAKIQLGNAPGNHWFFEKTQRTSRG